MRPEIARAILDVAFPTPRITLRDIEASLRKIIRDPLDAERKVGHLYGHVFRNKEVLYDAAGGRPEPK